MSAKDIFDNNAHANDPRTQFMNWALVANEAWDYPADSLGYMTGIAFGLNQADWAARYGFAQVPRTANGLAQDTHYFDAWAMVTEFERRYTLAGKRGTARLLAYLNRANMGSYEAALNEPNIDIQATRTYRLKYGFGLNLDQELTSDMGIFSRLGWSEGQHEAWMFADVDWTATLGVAIKGPQWHRPDDTVGLAGIVNGLSRSHQDYFAAGGLGILAGDGALNYGVEEILETYYDFGICKCIHAALDYQFVNHPAMNRDRGPVHVLGVRFHAEL